MGWWEKAVLNKEPTAATAQYGGIAAAVIVVILGETSASYVT